MSINSNQKFEKTSFLSKANSSFIEQMYLKYLNKDPSLLLDWKKYFEDLNEETSTAFKELEGPSWQPQKTKKYQVQEDFVGLKSETKKINTPNKLISSNDKDFEISSNDSINAIALIRAYRIRGHLIAHLDPLGMMDRKYIHDLHPEDHGFKKEEYNKKIFLGSYMDTGGNSSINEILTNLRKIYCSKIGVEYMHISDPAEKIWFRNRMEKKQY
jgi:2-oxoglutarate dehydrogenase E1 component